MSAFRRGTMGLAIGEDGITAVVRERGADRAERVVVPLDPSAPDFEATLVSAMRQLRSRIDGESGSRSRRVHVALLPPFAECRLLQLPPLRTAEADAVVRRDASRYFMSVPAPRITAVSAPRRSAGAQTLACATPAALLDVVSRAAAAVEWQVVGTAPAHAAWIAAAREASAAAGSTQATTAVAAVQGGTAHVLLLDGGAPQSLRRVPAGDVQDITASLGAEQGAMLLLAPPDARDALAAQLTAAGWTVHASPRSAAETAAALCASARPQLLPASAELERRRAERRYAAWLAAAAVVLLIGSAVIEMWGARRQLDAVQARRAEIRAQVGPLLSMRDSVDRLDQHSYAIERIAATAPRWTGALFELTMLLPNETHLTRLHTTGDTVVVEAEGSRAGATLQGMRSAASLRDARLLGPVERELADGTTSMERFRLSARLAGAPPRMITDSGGARPGAGGVPGNDARSSTPPAPGGDS